MRRSIKIILISTLLVGLYFLLPFSFGVLTQRYSTQFINNENNTLGKVLGIQLNLTQYHRGWFSSDAVLQIEKKNDVGDWQLWRNIPITIEHGPSFTVNNQKVVGIGMISATNVPLIENGPYKINIKEIIRFSGEHATVAFIDDQSAATVDHFRLASLIMHIHSNLKADRFTFKVIGKGLHVDDPQHALSVDVGDFAVNLNAHYLDDRHWQMITGLQSNNDAISMLVGNGATSSVAVHADAFGLDRLHFDTQDIAQLLGELVKIKQAADAKQPVLPSAWMALFQQLLVQIIHDDTTVSLAGLSVKTPMGELKLHYNVAFPTLPKSHDYFDIATRGVGQLKIIVPHWNYAFAAQNKQISLSDLEYIENNNTVFSRHSNLSFGAFDVVNSAVQSQAPLFYMTNFLYHGDLQGTIDDLSQLMNWKMTKLCLSGQCIQQLNGELKLMHMHYNAFRGIAAATQQLVQFDPKTVAGSVEAKWMDLATAYAKLISPKTTVVFSHGMMTPNGAMQLQANVSWPGLTVDTTEAHLLPTVMDAAVYQLHLQFPAIYVDEFLDGQAHAAQTTLPNVHVPVVAKPAEPSFDVQVADFLKYALQQGYLKKMGNTYQADLSGKGAVFTVNGVPWKSP